MSRQTGATKFTGKMSGMSFYKQGDEHFAKKGRGPSRDKIFNDPNFARNRENMCEFGGVATTVSSFIQTINTVKNLRDGKLHERVSKIFSAIVKRADNIRGQRDVLITKNRELLQSLEFNAHTTLLSVLQSRYTVSHDDSRAKGSVLMNEFRADRFVSAPGSATHFKLIHLMGVLSDTLYNTTLEGYMPADASTNTLSKTSTTELIPVLDNKPVTIKLECLLDKPLNEHVTVIQCLGVLFYEHIGTEYYPMLQDQCMKVVDVF